MDFAMNHRRALIRSVKPVNLTADEQIEKLAAGLAAKRIRAITLLGKRWVLHPQYSPAHNEHHRPSYKTSAVLWMFLHLRNAWESGRVS